MTYIQRKDSHQLETVDEFETYQEARAMLAECRLADPSAQYYLSSRWQRIAWLLCKGERIVAQSENGGHIYIPTKETDAT